MAKKKCKPVWKSKTMWFNAITLALGVLEVINGVYLVDSQHLLLINGIGNLLLRYVTDTAVVLK